MQRIVPDTGVWLPTPDAAWALVGERWLPSTLPAERVDLSAACGRVLAQVVCSPLDMPPFDRAAMDGYAVQARDLDGFRPASGLTIVGEVPMGEQALVPVLHGQAVWVATGSMIPSGADAVVNVERTSTADGHVHIDGPVICGDNIARRAADLGQGEAVLRAGRRLRPHDVGILASLGIPDLLVVRRPRVAVLVTGDELRLPGARLEPGQIYTSNGYALGARVRELGGEAVVWPLIPDDLGVIVATLREALTTAEIILVSGGSSVGVKDLTSSALEATAGTQILVQGVSAKPGRPSIVATVGDRLVVGIPGNPVAAMVSCAMFVEPALEWLLRLDARTRELPRSGTQLRARLGADITTCVGRQEYIFVALHADGMGGWNALPVSRSAASLSSMAQADGMVVARPDIERLMAGEGVEVSVL
jgi:molybdenum cofactor synthesis domain-containing protein